MRVIRYAGWLLTGLVLSGFVIQAFAGDAAPAKPKADSNQDGKVSYDEYKRIQEQKLQARFKKLDTNGDGSIDDAEKQAAKDKLRERRKHKEH